MTAPLTHAYFVTSAAMIAKFRKSGGIYAPVSLWTTIDAAKRMKKLRYGRNVILKCALPAKTMTDPNRPDVIVAQAMIPLSDIDEVTG